MFEQFGEMSYEQLLMAAEGQLKEGDIDSLKALAKENGIDEEIAMLYAEGAIPVLSDAMTAAYGKLDIEVQEMNEIDRAYGETIAEYVKGKCEEERRAIEVRNPKKKLQECLDTVKKAAEKKIVEKRGTVCVPVPPAEVFKIVRTYYWGDKGI